MTPYYQHNGITIYHGDCRELLPKMLPTCETCNHIRLDGDAIAIHLAAGHNLVSPCDLLITDPPYGIKADSIMARQSGQQYGRAAAPKRQYLATNWDETRPSPWLMQMLLEYGDHHIIWGGNYFGLPSSRCWLVWDKNNGANQFADCELAWTDLDKAVRKIEYTWNGMIQENMADKEERYHPTQKPLAVMKWSIRQAPESCKSVLDPFMGSGTTLIAAKNLGLTAIGIEAEERYCEIAAKRLSQEVFEFPEVSQ